MEDNFKLEIISPEKIIFSDNVAMVTLPSYEGDMSVLKHHISIITFLRPGIIKIQKNGVNFEEFFVQDGTIEYFNDSLMEKALAEVSETAGALNTEFDVSSDIGAILSRVDDQINKAKARSKVASDLSDQGIDHLKAKQAANKAEAQELLAQFKIEQGLAEPSSETSQKTVGPQRETTPESGE